MRADSVSFHSFSFRHAALLGVVALAVAGCARGVYKPHDLPQELQPPPVADVHRLDLSRIAGSATGNDVIAPGDVLEVAIASGYEEGELQKAPVRVGENGSANVLLVGRVDLAGLEVEQAEQAIAAAAIGRGVFRNPQVTVVLANRKSNRVTVVGAVNTPGVYELPRTSSGLLEALVAAGGLGDDAGRYIEIRRPGGRTGPQIFQKKQRDPIAANGEVQTAAHHETSIVPEAPTSARIDLVSAVEQGAGGNQIGDGDVIMVSRRDVSTIKVMGLVNRPGEFEIPRGRELRVLDAIALAGGRPLQIANKVKVIRNDPNHIEPVVVAVNLNKAKRDGASNLRLAPGDVVSVEETPTTMMVQTLQNFVRFGFSGSVPF